MLTLDDLQMVDGADERVLLIVNAYIINKGVKLVQDNEVPQAIKQAGVELAKAFIAGEFMAGRSEGMVVSKASKAGDVSVSKTYAQGKDSQPISAKQMIADALLEPYVKKGLNLSVPLTRA